jgi:hypothetical protein
LEIFNIKVVFLISNVNWKTKIYLKIMTYNNLR